MDPDRSLWSRNVQTLGIVRLALIIQCGGFESTCNTISLFHFYFSNSSCTLLIYSPRSYIEAGTSIPSLPHSTSPDTSSQSKPSIPGAE